jgi:hypothetical protein
MRNMTAWAGLMGCAILLAACSGSEPPLPAPAYTKEAPVRLAVNVVEVESRSPALAEANFIDERRTRELTEQTTTFLKDRILAAGGSGSASATIEQASVIERIIPGRSGGITGFVTGEQTYSIDANLRVRVTIVDASGADKGYAEAGVALTRTLRAGTSVVDRDYAARQLEADLLTQLDKTLRQSITDNLAAYVAPS